MLFFVCVLFVTIGILMVRDGQPMGYFVGGVFALGVPVAMLQFHPKAAYLHLTPEGFTFCSLFRPHTVLWTHVREFAIISIGPNRMVAWNFTPDYPATGRTAALSKSLSGYEAALPDTYGMKAQELVGLLESLRQRYVETANA